MFFRFEDVAEYVKLILETRLNEGVTQMAALKEGVNMVIPIDLLRLFSWQQLEFLVVGTADFSVEALKVRELFSISPSFFLSFSLLSSF